MLSQLSNEKSGMFKELFEILGEISFHHFRCFSRERHDVRQKYIAIGHMNVSAADLGVMVMCNGNAL